LKFDWCSTGAQNAALAHINELGLKVFAFDLAQIVKLKRYRGK
jgi:hypothetical protein